MRPWRLASYSVRRQERLTEVGQRWESTRILPSFQVSFRCSLWFPMPAIEMPPPMMSARKDNLRSVVCGTFI